MTPTVMASSELLLAVLVASVLGSLHCVGMCGPFALMASGGSTQRKGAVTHLTLYHLGRLLTYVSAAAIVGTLGAAISIGGQWLGIQSAAARIAGVAMVGIGVMRLWAWNRSRKRVADELSTASLHASPSSLGRRISGWIAQTRPLVNRLPPPARSLAAGSLTTLLPCGWLYLFLLVAAGTGGALTAVLVMAAFWIGTVPGLSLLVLGALRVAPQVRGALPILGALLLVLTGLYTATGRAAADLSLLSEKAGQLEIDRQITAESLDELSDQPLPCCQK